MAFAIPSSKDTFVPTAFESASCEVTPTNDNSVASPLAASACTLANIGGRGGGEAAIPLRSDPNRLGLIILKRTRLREMLGGEVTRQVLRSNTPYTIACLRA